MNKTIYLPVHAVSVSDSVECVRLINESFQYDEAPFFTVRATTVNSILFFAYMCQYITYEELFGDPDILLNFECLKHILCRFFHTDDVLDCYRSLVSKITLQADSADTACHDYFFDSGLQIIQINRFLVKVFFSTAEYGSNIMQWLPDNPDEEKNLRELIFKEGLE